MTISYKRKDIYLNGIYQIIAAGPALTKELLFALWGVTSGGVRLPAVTGVQDEYIAGHQVTDSLREPKG